MSSIWKKYLNTYLKKYLNTYLKKYFQIIPIIELKKYLNSIWKSIWISIWKIFANDSNYLFEKVFKYYLKNYLNTYLKKCLQIIAIIDLKKYLNTIQKGIWNKYLQIIPIIIDLKKVFEKVFFQIQIQIWHARFFSNTNTNTGCQIFSNTNTNTPCQILSNTNTNTPYLYLYLQIQIRIWTQPWWLLVVGFWA